MGGGVSSGVRGRVIRGFVSRVCVSNGCKDVKLILYMAIIT